MKKLLILVAALAAPLAASATFHIIHIEEVYSNADGTIQFVELQADSGGQTELSLAEVVVQNATGTTTTPIFDFTADFPALDNGETVLLATPAAQAALGFTADFTIPANSLPLGSGRVIFRQDNASSGFVDAVAYGSFTGSNTGYGTPAAALPSDGTNSLTHTAFTGNNSTTYSAAANTPRRNDGTTGSLSPTSDVENWAMY